MRDDANVCVYVCVYVCVHEGRTTSGTKDSIIYPI